MLAIVKADPKAVVNYAPKQRKHELADDEAAAVRDELLRLVKVLRTKREVGKALGYGPTTDSQTVERAIRVRPGREIATNLYAYLKTTREVFLAARGVAVPITTILVAGQDESMWTAAGFDDDASRRLAAAVRDELAAMKKRR